jgi:hypothetical protein
VAVVRATRKPAVLKSVVVPIVNGRADALHTALSQISPVPAAFTYMALGEREVFRKLVELPQGVREKEITSVVTSEVASFLPAELQAMEVSYQMIPHPAGPRFVVVTAVETAMVEAQLQDAAGAKLFVRAIDTLPACLIRALDIPTRRWHNRHLVSTDSSALSLTGFSYFAASGEVLAGVALGPTVLAVSQLQASAVLETNAAALIDELNHLAKFIANRLDLATPIIKLVVGSDDGTVAVDVIANQLAEAFPEATTTYGSWVVGSIPFPLVAVGAGLYPLYSGGSL